jgi:hypothetical protein
MGLGKHHIAHLSVPQLQKLHSAHKKGCKCMIKFDKHQIDTHGAGFFGDMKNKVTGFIKKHNLEGLVNPIVAAAKKSAHHGINKLSDYAHKKVAGGAIHCKRGCPAKGAGVIGDIAGLISKGANLFGVGVHRKTH